MYNLGDEASLSYKFKGTVRQGMSITRKGANSQRFEDLLLGVQARRRGGRIGTYGQ